MHKVISVSPQNDYKLLVTFENVPLKDISVFNKAYIEYGAVTWKDQGGNEIDICPDKMYMDSVSCDDLEAIAAARQELSAGATVSHNAINWD